MQNNLPEKLIKRLRRTPLARIFSLPKKLVISDSKKGQVLITIAISLILMLVFFVLSNEPKKLGSSSGPPPTPVPLTEQTPEIITSPDDNGFFQVLTVIDGDTIYVNVDGNSESVRLIGIDTPEIARDNQPLECFGLEASNKTKEKLENQRVRMETDESQGDRDQFGRLLRFVFLEDGTNFNELLVREGFAHELTYDGEYKYRNQFITAQTAAQNENLGLWHEGVCESN